jgi:nucleotide-binding universal stress UspA family protein
MNTNLFERVLVPVELSEFDELAVRYALLFNQRLGSKLTLLHAEEVSWLATEQPIGYYFENANEAKEELRMRLNELANRYTPEGARVSALFVDDDAAHAIVETADEMNADLIIMATHGRKGVRRALIGSVTETVLHEMNRPVMTVTPRLHAAGTPIAIRTILCPVNFSEVARCSLEQAAAVAESFDAELIVMHVAEENSAAVIRYVEERFGRWVDPLVRERTRYRQIVVHGDAAASVISVADQIGADLLVIGAQHKRFSDTTVIGTTTERVTRFSRAPVMTVIRKPAFETAKEERYELTTA